MSFYDDLEKSLLEAIEIEKGGISVEEKKGMPAPTYFVREESKEDQFYKKEKKSV